ncbi:hypothetical protein DF156_20970 [Burkholderia ubonensis]|nr:hypothetical protein CJO70_17410 [Burkholderia ubonensis]PAJ93404.1 hypothetical protein CJO69_17130 [Burkholderia ubonensis]PAK06381.1 hypothetical protein CJO67_18625 [Burkholderia ubonensis]PAK12183.1 hypothetical protein CJO66_24050 [Burkholderia ubonensis]RQP31422.1 hypothetical protein DF155_20685 [Burkholderia ubonensis]
MPTDHPLIRLPRVDREGARIKPRRRPRFPKKISFQEQSKRFEETFQAISRSVEAWENGIDVSTDPRAVVPDRALVFELIGPVEAFEAAAAELGFEWLAGERVARGSRYDEDADEVDSNEADSSGQLYLTMPSQAGLKDLKAKWAAYCKGNLATTPADKALWSLFSYLRDVRTYSAQDRIDSSVIQYIQKLLAHDPDRPVVIEINLWFRATAAQRALATQALVSLLEAENATLLDSVTIEEIQYQAALVRVSVAVAYEISQRHGAFANADEVMAIRAQSVPLEPAPESTSHASPSIGPLPPANAPCFTALLDGYPITEHDALRGRLIVAEADVTALHAPVTLRYHGTAMASLVIHGDLHDAQPTSLPVKVAVTPVLASLPGRNIETTPAGKLPVGVIYRAVKTLLAGTADKQVKRNEITLINHSICGNLSSFSGRASPWAALLDYLAFKHNLLFVVSAGNIADGFMLDDIDTEEEFADGTDAIRLGAILLGLERAKSVRSILAPAESINALSVGALHADGSGPIPNTMVDPFPNQEMTNLCSAIGPGINRSIKPDLVEYGGRIGAMSFPVDGGVKLRGATQPRVGQRVACPDPAGSSNRTASITGTSNAAALVTRTGAQIATAVEETYRTEEKDFFSRRTRAVILKALIAHSCQWGEVTKLLEGVFPPEGKHKWSRRRDTITSFFGYGRPQPDRVISGNANRATLIADDEIGHDQLHEYRIPIPTALVNSRDVRRIVVTLAWAAPASVATSAYQGFAMNFVAEDGSNDLWKRVDRTFQPNMHTSVRGTLIHTVFEGHTRTKFNDAKGLFIGVQARCLSKRFENETIPYALAVTVEIASSQQTTLYADVRAAIPVRSRQTTRIQQRQR